MKYDCEIEGHKISLLSNGTGSIDPWSEEYARSIGVSLMCTADMADFMLVDGTHIYKFDRNNDVYSLYQAVETHLLEKWEDFNIWLASLMDKKRVRDCGYLEDRKKSIDFLKRKDIVWKSIPEKDRRSTYEYLKTLSKDEINRWYEERYEKISTK